MLYFNLFIYVKSKIVILDVKKKVLLVLYVFCQVLYVFCQVAAFLTLVAAEKVAAFRNTLIFNSCFLYQSAACLIIIRALSH